MRGERVISSSAFAATMVVLWLVQSVVAAPGLAAPSGEPGPWQKGDGFRFREISPITQHAPGFTHLTGEQTGILFTNLLPYARYRTNQILLNGSGMAAGDVDGDGLCDVYFCGLDRPNALYRNLGNWRFQDIAAEAGVRCEGLTSTGAALADFDGDGDLDLIVNSVGHGTRLFLNDGHGHFTLAGVFNQNKGGMSLALGDLNGDGFLDLYVANYRTLALMDMPNTRFTFNTVNGQRVVSKVNGRPATDPEFLNRFRVNARGGIEENGEVDEVLFNVNGSALQPVPFLGGAFLDEDGRPVTETPTDWGLSVVIRDLNQDGRPDIWVCNDFDTPDRIWLNQGGGVFRAAPRLALRKSSHFSMGIDVADINRDGWDDVFVVDMLSRDHRMRMDMMGDRNPPVDLPGQVENRPNYMINTLFLNRGDGTYAEIAQLAGVAATDWSWTPLFVDVDLDGYEDLLVANGNERAARSLDVSERLRAIRTARQLTLDEIFDNRRMFPRQNAPNLAFRNRHDLTFEEVGKTWGFDEDGVSHGMVLADLDNDGDPDVLVNNLNGAVGIYRNEAAGPRISVRLKGQSPNTHGIGARVIVRGAGLPEQSQVIQCGGRYLSSDDPVRTFAGGSPTNLLEVAIDWPSGRRSLVRGLPVNRLYEFDESAAKPGEPSKRPTSSSAPRFEDVSARLHHAHHEDLFDDFAVQPLVPHRLSQLGPGLAWTDVDGDGWDDLVIGSGSGGQLSVLRNRRGGFELMTNRPAEVALARDLTTLIPWRPTAGGWQLLAGASSYEDGLTNAAMVRVYEEAGSRVQDLLPDGLASVGPMAMADVDGDGFLDLFVGGRVLRGQFPQAASSSLWRGDGTSTGFKRDEASVGVLRDVGMVSGAVFSDLDGDAHPDLILACEWGPLVILRNERGQLVRWNPPIQITGRTTNVYLGDLIGQWNAVATGDFDGDGRMDIVASNVGRNSRWEEFRELSPSLVYGDFSRRGVMDVFESHFDRELKKVVPDRQLDFLARSMPFLKERYSSNLEFARASVDEMLREQASSSRRIVLTWFESTVFLNRGDHFEARPLPMEAQFAPAFGVCVADFNGDGVEDLFLSQNFFANYPDNPRQDAGLGLILEGDGRGRFRALSAQESGLRIFGEQRGAAVADFDGDGSVDLVVSQNGGETKLYRNLGRGRPGLRVRLTGPAKNSEAIGAMVRLRTNDRLGPAHELHAGGGYWSVDSSVLVLATALGQEPTAIWVRWPDGTVATHPIPPGAKTVQIDAKSIRSVDH